MVDIKPQPPSPSPTREVDAREPESYDLYTPDTLRASGSSSEPTNNRKRPSTASSSIPPAKRPRSATPRNQTGQPKARPRPKPRTKTPTIVWGFDFGTTYSGMAYAHSGNAGLGVNLLTRWDDTTTDYVKIPSAIDFGAEGDTWGVDAKSIPGALKWFKLRLVNPSDLDEGIRDSVQLHESREALQALGKSAVGVIGAFLKRMFQHAVEKLKVARGQETVDSSRFHVVFTVPAIWPEYARRRMQKAVQRGGILDKRQIGPTSHEFLSEPEAAALATLSSLDGLPNMKAGDTIVVADCGGGTVDIITYKIIKTNPMTVEEVVQGKGALCGAIFVEERFKELVIKKLEEKAAYPAQRIRAEEIQEIMTRNWEGEIRKQFTGAAKTWTIPQPISLMNMDWLSPDNGYQTFTITSEEVEEVFRPNVEKIVSLVNSQITTAVEKDGNLPKYAILVGGFGSSGYLREYLKPRCQGVEILQCGGSEPWSAISRGAVIHGMTKKRFGSTLKVAVKSRIARESYGVVCEEPWDGEVHHPGDKKFDFILLKDMSIRVMKWHLVQGDEVPAKHTTSINFTKYLDQLPVEIITIIYKSPAEDPPARKDDSVTIAAEIIWNIQVDWESLQIFVNESGKTFRMLEYTVEMNCSAGATDFSVTHRGRRQASKNVTMRFYDSADA